MAQIVRVVFSWLLIMTISLSYFAMVVRSSNEFGDNNVIRLVSYRNQRDTNFLIDSSFTSYPANAIYQFGDSVSDNGNLIRLDPNTDCGNWPYGESYSDHPTGRCSDGLLIVDFFARFMNLPFIDPYLNKKSKFTHGVNFAVGGATALDASDLEEKYNISVADDSHSLSTQLDWFKSHLHKFYPNSSERRSKLAKSLFIVGEFGGNDYNAAFGQGKTVAQVNKMVPDIVQTIRDAVEEIIDEGASQIAIPGPFPLGCMSIYLKIYKTNDTNKYDEVHCLKKYNIPIIYHNELLQQTIFELRRSYPNVVIVFIDNYGAFREMLRRASSFGFNEDTIEDPCCEADRSSVSKLKTKAYLGTTHVSLGTTGVTVCENPREYISWDGLHLTQRAYQVMAEQFIRPINAGTRVSNIWGCFSFIIVALFFI